MNAVTRPLVRYHGGKWMLASWIISHFPPHRVYVEPFGGGGSVLLRKPRSYAEVYNDLDSEIVNLFRVARDQGEELQRRLHLTPFARDELLAAYESSDDPIERARHTVVRAFMGFASAAVCGEVTGFRANSNIGGTTPAHDWQNFPEAFAVIIERLRCIVIENKYATDIMQQHDASDTLHYCDPPYVHSTRSDKTRNSNTKKSYKFELYDNEHRDLAEFLHGLHGMVIVSGYPSALYGEIYHDWQRVERPALADGARPRTEVLWMNPQCAGLQRNMRLL